MEVENYELREALEKEYENNKDLQEQNQKLIEVDRRAGRARGEIQGAGWEGEDEREEIFKGGQSVKKEADLKPEAHRRSEEVVEVAFGEQILANQ